MARKLTVGKVADCLKKNEIDPAILRRIIEELNMLDQDETGEEKPPAVKQQFCIVISDPEGKLPKADFVGWILKLPESEAPVTTLYRLNQAAYSYNASKKGRLLPVKTHGEAIEAVPKKFFKEADLVVVTKVPVLMLRTSNEIPKE